MGQIDMQKNLPLVLISAGAALLLPVIFWMQSWSGECDAALKRTVQQYGELQSLLSTCAARQHDTPRSSRTESENLFRLLNEKGKELGIARRIEGMRPLSGRDAAVELLDVRIRPLYLSECVKLIESLEQTEHVAIDSMNMQVTDKGLLNVDMRISRKKE